MIRSLKPTLEPWEVNISAGNALEIAYHSFTGHNRGSNMASTVGDNLLAVRVVRPDFIHSTEVLDAEKDKLSFLFGGIIEVKAPQNPITLKTNNNQIDAEMNLARWADANNGFLGLFSTQSNEVKGGAFTLVVPVGTVIGDDVIEAATKRNVNLYVQYAFISKKNGSIVFSNPEKLNNITSEVPYPVPGNLNKPGVFDVYKATRWAPSQRLVPLNYPTEENPTNNSATE